MPNFRFYGGRKQATTKFSFSFWTWIWFLGIQLQESSIPKNTYHPPHHRMFQWLQLIEIFRSYSHLIFPILFQKVQMYDMCGWIVWIWSLSPSKHLHPDHAPIVIVIQSKHLKHSISPRNQSANHPESGCFGVSGVVIGSALSKGCRSGPEAFRMGHFFRLDLNWEPRMKNLWHPG